MSGSKTGDVSVRKSPKSQSYASVVCPTPNCFVKKGKKYSHETVQSSENFNLADGELYYSQKALIYATDLNTKETRIVADSSSKDVDLLLVIGKHIYWTADVKKLYFFITEGTGNSAKMCIYELDLSVPLEEAEDKLTLSSSTRTKSDSVFYAVNGNFYTIGTNGFLMSKEEETWRYESVFYDDIDDSLRTAPMTVMDTLASQNSYWAIPCSPYITASTTKNTCAIQ